MTCIIVEDQPPAQRILQKYIQDAEVLQLKGTYSSALEAMDFLGKEAIDIMFLDIHLPKLSGIEFLKTLGKKPHVILTTAFSEYALESYELNVVDYLLKPFSFERFLTAIHKIPKTQVQQLVTAKDHIFIKSGYEHLKINIPEIYYIQADQDYTEIHQEKTKHLTQERLKEWEGILPSAVFLRIHKSYLINTHKILKVMGNRVHLDNGVQLPIGRAYKEEFVQRVLK